MSTNAFKSALAACMPQIGLWLCLANADAAEVCATAGFDWLLIDGEHAPNDVRTILAQLRAVAPYRAHPVVRPVSGDVQLIKQLLDVGAQTLLVPMVETAGQARELVLATRYPPQGIRGDGSPIVRASRWGLEADYLRTANDEVCLLVQVETRRGLDNLDAICAVDGVDGVFIGPADLSASLGHRGNPGHPDVQAAIDAAIATICAHGKAAGILTSDTGHARRYLGLGCTFVAVGVDVRLLALATRALAAEFAQRENGPAPYQKDGLGY
ncbi:MAG TPA: 4-hydroxy-2-oxoheptanedioate aldolase [Noviherbaspirillum sp.]|nr:4-hydroxy-2-oxoheptanedioate aldolase [Noviherbaspirillum sp.]